MNAKDKIKKELASLKSSARDIEELNKIQLAIDLTKELSDNSLGIVCAKLDKLYSEVIDKKYGK